MGRGSPEWRLFSLDLLAPLGLCWPLVLAEVGEAADNSQNRPITDA